MRSVKCEHKDFVAQVDVQRIIDQGSIVFNAEIKVRCSQCGEPFRFLGVGPGWSANGPKVNGDATELRAAIEAQSGSTSPVEDTTVVSMRRLP